MNEIVETTLHYAVIVILIVAVFVGIRDYGLPAFTDVLIERLEKAASAS